MEDVGKYQKFKSFLGDEKYYYDFLVFWQKELVDKDVDGVLKEYVFKGDERADDLLIRLYGGKS